MAHSFDESRLQQLLEAGQFDEARALMSATLKDSLADSSAAIDLVALEARMDLEHQISQVENEALASLIESVKELDALGEQADTGQALGTVRSQLQ